MFTDVSRLDDGATGYAVVWKAGQNLEGRQNPNGLQPGGLRRRVRRSRPRAASGITVEHDSGTSHPLLRCAGSHQEDGIGRTGSRPAVRPSGKEAHRCGRQGRASPLRSGGARPTRASLGNEKADEWAKIAAEEPDTRGVEWLNYDYNGRSEVRAMPLPRSLANLKREISEMKWVEARQWAGGRTSKTKYRMLKSQKPDGAVTGSTKSLASRFYQIKTRHCLTGRYLHWTTNRATPQCWCRYRTQTRDHLFKERPKWKPQQKILWAEVRKVTGRWKDRWKVRDLLADGRCSLAVLDFLSTTDVGRRVPAEEDDAVSAVSKLEVREWLEEQGAGAEDLGAGGTPLFLPTPEFMASAGTV